MINIPMNCSEALDGASLSSINASRSFSAVNADNILSINTRKHPVAPGNTTAARSTAAPEHTASPVRSAAPMIAKMPIPALKNPVSKGQKVSLGAGLSKVHACLGWNVSTADCDIDVSAFLLNKSGKVVGDSWFVFYGQTESPDKSTCFVENAPNDREMVTVDFTKLNPSVDKIVFVLTINDAFAKNQNFGMVQDAYIRIINPADQSELVGFQLTDCFPNITSMVIGEIYQYNGSWKFNAFGNGLARDLAGLCEFYGVQVI